MRIRIKLLDFGDETIRIANDICQNPSEISDFLEFFMQKSKLKCEKCQYEFDLLLKKTIAGIDKIIQNKSGIYSMQFEFAQSSGIIDKDDNICCPKCNCQFAYLTDN